MGNIKNQYNTHLLIFTIPSLPYSIITEEPVYMYITCGLGNQF